MNIRDSETRRMAKKSFEKYVNYDQKFPISSLMLLLVMVYSSYVCQSQFFPVDVELSWC